MAWQILFAVGLLMFLPGAAVAGPVRSASPGTTLLVLPFENVAHNSRLEWLGEGLVELGIERMSGQGRVAYPRQVWMAALEKLGLPDSRHYSRATMTPGDPQ